MILSSHGIIGSQITQFVGLLDTYSGAAAAYSLRRLRTAYTGSAIRVRNSSNSEADIGFVNNELDTASLLSHCGAGDGFVKTWYDQSGNAYDAEQTTAANQPQIVSSGSVITENGKPTTSWTTSSRMGNSSFNPSSSIGFSAFNVYSTDLAATADTANMFLYSFGQLSNTNYFHKNSQTGSLSGEFVVFARNVTTTIGRLGSSTYRRSANTQVLESEFYLSSGFTFYQNNSAQNMDLSTGGATTTANWSPSIYTLSGGLFINSWVNLSDSVNCKMQEIIFYDNSQSSNRTGIETNINDFYSIY